jgi:PPOX class probable FMN-dependent enzyme
MDDAKPPGPIAGDPFAIAGEEQLRTLYHKAEGLAVRKSIGFIDKHARAFIALSPFLTLSTQSPDGRADVSPRGDPPGFVRVLDPKRLLIPDRSGNNRLDSLTNILANPCVGLLFFIPGFEDSLRINGRARLTRDPALLAGLEMQGKAPKCGIEVTVDELFFHCAKAFKRARLWAAEAQVPRATLPGLGRMILEQTEEAKRMTEEQIAAADEGLEWHYKNELYE